MGQTEFRTDQEVGNQIKALRTAQGFSQEDLGERLGLGQPAVSKIEKGDRALTGRELVVLAALFGVTTGDILRDSETPPVLFRIGDGDAGGAADSLRMFRRCIDEYHGLETVVRGGSDAV